MTTRLKTDIILGERYRDTVTGLEGVATAVTFYLHACERVSLEFTKDGEVKFESFDAPRVEQVATGAIPTVTRTGGPGGREARPNPTPRR